MTRAILAVMFVLGAAMSNSWAQTAPAGPSTLRVTVKDATDLGLPHATVVLTDAQGVEYQAAVDPQGVATFTSLQPGAYQVRASAEGFREVLLQVEVRRGNNAVSATLAVAISEELTVSEQGADSRRDNGFTQTLTADEIDALSDDPDEMADQLAQMAGPGAQIFVDGFSGGRLPPKDQIQQIRFNSNSFSAEYHEAGMVRVEVITRPGAGGWRGRANFGFRDESLNSRNAFSSTKEPTQQQRFNVSFQGPIVKGKTGISLSVDGNNAFDSRTIRAQSPGAGTVTGLARNTTDGLNANFRLDHAIGQGGQIRAEYQRRGTDRGNLGVGDFDLSDRSYDTSTVNDTFRVRNTRVLGKKVFSELKFELTSSESTTTPQSFAPTIRVNDAFTSGGAGQMGSRSSREVEIAQNFDFTIGRKHSMRAGVLFEAGWWSSDQQQNTNGTYVFTSLEAYNAGLPATYTLRVGDPLVEYSQVKAGWFLQDDFRIGRNLSVSLGLRQEIQTQVNDAFNVAPRAAFTWTANRRTTIRGGYGIFYDWYDSNLYEQTIRVDGRHQLDIVVQDPGFPADAGGGIVLPSSIIRSSSLTQPIIQQASIGMERTLTPWASLRTDYMWTRGSNTLRSVNVNAPIDGVRPDPAAGNVSEIQSTGRRASDRLTVGVNARHERLRLFSNVMYQLQSSRNYADSATSLPSDSTNPDVDWGPSAQDIRHRLFVMVNAPIWKGIRAGFNMQVSSAAPYTITTGRDENGDTVFNDRPAGIERNSERGAGMVNASLRLSKAIGFGGPSGGGPGGMPMPMPPGGGGGGAMNQRGPGGPGGGGGPQIMVMEATNARYRLDFYAQISNLFNNVNYNTFVGNVLSPFFGQATSAGPARRMEVGMSLGF
ncbi:MAG: carboxypeptidase regulatory-like domain-containing protein [Acidobacteria bacterium]|nr:carboxypeptidase regulatory-like domain-containing protein [Acidobacteriota bacterium]